MHWMGILKNNTCKNYDEFIMHQILPCYIIKNTNMNDICGEEY